MKVEIDQIQAMKEAVASFRARCSWIPDKVFASFAEDMEDYIRMREIELGHDSNSGKSDLVT